MNKVINTLQNSKDYKRSTISYKSSEEWHNVIMLHWSVTPEDVAKFLPPGLVVDTLDGKAWISWVSFTVRKMRIGLLPSLPYFSNFEQVHFRTYVIRNRVSGMYIFSIEANKFMAVFLTNFFARLSNKFSSIYKNDTYFECNNEKMNFKAAFCYIPLDELKTKSKLDQWLTERHVLYQKIKDELYQFDVYHKRWSLSNLNVHIRKLHHPFWKFKKKHLKPDYQHFSYKIKVRLSGRRRVDQD